MDKPVQIILFLAAFFSLRLTDFLPKDSHAQPESAHAFATSANSAEGRQIESVFAPQFLNPGLQIIDFQVNRTTFGFSDVAYTQPFDTAQANKKVALGCDILEMRVVAVVSGISLNDSIGIRVFYGNPDGSISSNPIFVFDVGQVRLTSGNNSFDCVVTPSSLSSVSVLGQKTLDFNLHDCLTSHGIVLQSGDTVTFSGKFQVNPNGPISHQFNSVPNFSASAYASQNGASLSCDTLFENFTLAKSEVVFDFPNTLNGLPFGCDEGELNWRLFVPDNDFSDWFGNELRPSTKVDSLVFDFDPGLLTAFNGGMVEVSIPGHPIFGSGYYPIRPLSDFPDGHYVAQFDTLSSVPSLNLVQTFSFDLRVRLTPTCESTTGSASGDHVYGISSAISYTDRFYASFIGDGSCVNKQTEQASSSVAYTAPPMLALTPTTSPAAPLIGGFATWEVQLCNTSGQSDAGQTWLALEDPTGQLNFGTVSNITNPGNPTTLALMPYGQNVFAFNTALPAGQCMKFRITASTNSCDDVPLNVRSGWNCVPYPPTWTPDQNAPCSSEFLLLSLTNSVASVVQVNFAEVASQCSGSGEEVTINGSLVSPIPLPNDAYTLSFVEDENGDQIPQIDETVVAQLVVSGSISPSNSLTFSQLIQLSAAQVCRILLKVESSTGNGCSSFATSLPVPQLLNAGEDRTFCGLSNLHVSTLGETPCDTAAYQFAWTALPPATLAMLNLTDVANPELSFNPAIFPGQTLQFVLETVRLSCGNSSFDTVSVVVPANANGVFEDEQLSFQVADCQSVASVCAEIPVPLFPNYVFTVNGSPYSGVFNNCSGGYSLDFAPGQYQLIATDTVEGCTDTVLVTVNCTTTEVLQVNLLLGESDTICVTSAELSGAIEVLNNICLDGQFVDYQVLNDSCMVVLGDLVGEETACLVACDSNGFCDTTLVEINVSHPFQNGIKDTVTITQQRSFCFDEQQLNLTGNLASIQNLCPDTSGNSVAFSIDSAGFCLDFLGLSVGTDTACIQLCDDLGNCDTLNICVSVVPGNVFRDTVFLLLETDTFCLPTGLLPGAIVSIEDVCPENSGDNVNFNVSGDCIFYNGFAIGTDTACYRFEDQFGNVALFEMQISVRKTTPSSFCDTIFVGQSKLHCLDVSELPGDFADGSMREICEDERTGNVELTINESGSCVFYEGLTPGRDSSCMVFCDDFGFCDTINFCFFVKPYFDPPMLGADMDSTIKGTPIVIDFLANDTIFGGIEDIFVLDEPLSGTVVLNLDNSFTYIPFDDVCARWDEFSYVACNPNGCDTTTVNIYIECIELTIFTAVSPNNDDVNDFFYIAKIEEFPDNHLWVYNVWGSLVYEATAYQNNWPGTWGADSDLPDGTYYFILEWTDNGSTTVQKGFIEMFR